MSDASYVKPLTPRRFGLRERLLLALMLGALATLLVAIVGWISFQRVVSSQQAIVRETLPAADALHEAVRGNARLAALAPRLAQADSTAELDALRATVASESARIRERFAALRSPHVEPELRARLQAAGAELAQGVEAMADAVSRRLALRAARAQAAAELRETIEVLDGIARMHAENATALLVTTLTGLLQPETEREGTDMPAAARAAARDRLLDLDLDGLERMHELTLAVHALAFLVDRLDEVDTTERLATARSTFEAHLALLERRLRDIPDPAARSQARALQATLAAALGPAGAVDLRSEEIALRARSELLQNQLGNLTTDLDALAGELIHRGGRILAAAATEADQSTSAGLIAFGIVLAALLIVTGLVSVGLLRRHSLSRLLALEQATLALAAGQRDVRIDTAGDDALASLSRALERFRNDAIERDRLAEALHQHRQDLENQVLARTAELREANAALARETAEHARARAAAEQADQAKTAFLGTLSHELRTPMAGILGLLELLEGAPPAAERGQYLAQMRTAAMLLLELLEDMLDFARIEAGGVHLDSHAFSLRDAVNDVFAVQGTRADSRGLALVADFDPRVPDTVVGDRRKLSQILLNLVGNAIKFSDEGAVTVHAGPGDRPGLIRFAVEDHGIGIAPARQREVFEPFVQVRESGRHHAGTGLGLAVCQRLVTAMGGEISLDSRPGLGTTVTFTLPLTPGEMSASAPGAGSPPAEDTPAALAPGHRILVVEDDAVNRMVVERFLAAIDQQPLCADSIQNALGLLAGTQPVALALIDMNLPDGDGREMLARLRAMPAHARTPAVLMSAHLAADQRARLLSAGFAAFLAKPFTRAQLGATLAGALGGATPAAPAAALPDMAEASPWVDAAFLRDEEDALGPAAVGAIVAAFLRQGEDLTAALRTAAAAGDGARCARLAHTLRGAAYNLGLKRLGDCAAGLEREIDAVLAEGTLGARTAALLDAYRRSVEALAALGWPRRDDAIRPAAR